MLATTRAFYTQFTVSLEGSLKKNQVGWEELGGWRKNSHLSTSGWLSGEKIRFYPVSIFPSPRTPSHHKMLPPHDMFSHGVWCSEAELGGTWRATRSTVHCTGTTWSSPEQLRISQGPWGWKKARTNLGKGRKERSHQVVINQAGDNFQILSSVFPIKGYSCLKKLRRNFNLCERTLL